MKNNEKILDLKGEIWKDIVGYEGLYQVSNMGRIKSLVRKFNPKEKLIGHQLPTKYYVVNFNNGVGNKQIFVHRLVAQTFIPNPHQFTIVHHIDHNPSNNKITNLTWVTAQQNSQYARKFKRFNIVHNKRPRVVCRLKTPNYYIDPDVKLENEVWIPIKNYEGYYEISNYGRVKSLERQCIRKSYQVTLAAKFLKPVILTNGYLRVKLSKEQKIEGFLLHRLVATNFISNPYNHPIINHKNSNKTDNHVNNLEWTTYKENIAHAIKSGTFNYNGERNTFARFIEKDILKIRHLREDGCSIRKLGKLFNTHPSVISNISNRKTWKHI